jgi:hypothetical protein
VMGFFFAILQFNRTLDRRGKKVANGIHEMHMCLSGLPGGHGPV